MKTIKLISIGLLTLLLFGIAAIPQHENKQNIKYIYDDDLQRKLESPVPWNLPAAYMVYIQTAEGSAITYFAASNLEEVKNNLRVFLIIYCADKNNKIVVKIWDRTELKYISLSGAQINQVNPWIPVEVTVHVGSHNL